MQNRAVAYIPLMTGSDIKPNAQSGGAAITASKKARDRKPKTMRGRPAGAEQTEYEKCGIANCKAELNFTGYGSKNFRANC